MSSYFDAVRAQVGELARKCPTTPQGDTEFIAGIMEIEAPMIRACDFFAGDVETPEDVRQAILGCISLDAVRFDGDTKIPTPGANFALVARSSKLESNMHSLWHDIARMRYEMRYGPVSDDPQWAVERRDAFDAEREQPWRNSHPHLVLKALQFNDYRPPRQLQFNDYRPRRA
jgi:hypothetical protein